MIQHKYSIIFLILISCNKSIKEKQPTIKPTKQFTSLDKKDTGVRFRNDLNENLSSHNSIYYFEYFYNGGGVAIGDINNDQLPDIFFTSNTSSNKLYLNQGEMKFKDISKSAGINIGKHWSTGVTMVDINNDNFLDIYVCQGGLEMKDKSKRENLLYINNGDNTFTEQGKKYGLNNQNLSTQSSFFDYDKDGDLDCIIANETEYFRRSEKLVQQNIISKPDQLRKNSTSFYENVNGKFIDKTMESGILKYSYNLGVVTADFNNDNWPDIYLTNDYEISDYLFINQKDGTFKEQIKSKTKHTSWFSMGVDYNDINNDGNPDISVVDMSPADHIRSKVLMRPMSTNLFWHHIKKMNRHYGYMYNSLQLNNGNGNYSNISYMAGTSQSGWSWANLLADFNNDGYKDNYIANGIRKDFTNNDALKKLKKLKIKSPKDDPKTKQYHQSLPGNRIANKMYENKGDLKFKDVTKTWGLTDLTFSNGAAYADLDLDGDLDIVVNNLDDFASIIQNNSETICSNNNYIQFALPQNAQGYNTKIKLYLDNNEILFQEYIPTRGYCSSVDHLIHFGLGSKREILKAEITWPNGKTEIKKDLTLNKIITLNPNKAHVHSKKPLQNALISELDPKLLGLDFTHIENDFNDFDKQTLLPYKHSTTGPCIVKADFNKDGLEDIFIGNSFNQESQLYFQTTQSTFKKSTNTIFSNTTKSEATDVISLDFDKDGDLDILELNGSYEFEKQSPHLKDRLYINNGKGIFSKASKAIFNPPNINSSVASVADINGDGFMDIMVGGRVIPGEYPRAELGYFMLNKKGKFSLENAKIPFQDLGIIRDAKFVDINQDKKPDLVVASEWEQVKILINTNSEFNMNNILQFEGHNFGWWNTVKPFDIDRDGDLDLLVGNVGQNTKFETNKDQKLGIRANDFDNNGTLDIVLSKDYKGQEVPVRGLQCSSEQMPFIKEKFKSYEGFAKANLNEILGKQGIDDGLSKVLTETRTGVFINTNNSFTFSPMSNIAQISPISKFVTHDINKDGIQDIIMAGNLFDTEVETPRWDAGNGLALLNFSSKDQIDLKPLTINKSGINIPNDFRDMTKIKLNNGKTILIALNNNDKLQIFELP